MAATADENKTADKNICETEGGSILSPRRVAKILEEKTIPRFLFDILHQQGKLDLSCDNTLFTVQAIDPFEKTNPFGFEKNVNFRDSGFPGI